MSSPPPPPPIAPAVRRVIYAGSGIGCVTLGVVGIVLPGLPTTPFLLAAAYFFARSSPRLSAWLNDHRVLGPYVRAVRDDHAMPRRAKAYTIGLLWITIGASIWLLAHGGQATAATVAACASLVVVAVAVTWFVGWGLGTADD